MTSGRRGTETLISASIPLRRASILALAGVVFGILASRASNSGLLWLLDLVSWPAIYVALLVALIRKAFSAKIAAMMVLAVFIPFVIAYYGTVFASFGTFPQKYALVWLIGAVLLGPVSALIYTVIHRGRLTGSLVSAFLAAGALADGSVLLLLQHGVDDARAHVIQILVDLLCAAWVIYVANVTVPRRLVAGVAFVPLAALVLVVGAALHYGLSRFR